MEIAIINADDYGMSKAVNDAIELSFRNEMINQTTLMVNMLWTEDAVWRAFEYGFADRVGLHLNLVEGKPLTEEIKRTSLCNVDGCFNGTILRKRNNRFFLNRKTKKAVQKEIKAQIEKYLEYGFTLKHIDSHEHAHTNISLILTVLKVCKIYEFRSIRLSRNIPKSKVKGLKRIYKKIINRRITQFNQGHGNYRNIQYFGSLDDCNQVNQKFLINTELMLHPIMNSFGDISDSVLGINITEWEKEKMVRYYAKFY